MFSNIFTHNLKSRCSTLVFPRLIIKYISHKRPSRWRTVIPMPSEPNISAFVSLQSVGLILAKRRSCNESATQPGTHVSSKEQAMKWNQRNVPFFLCVRPPLAMDTVNFWRYQGCETSCLFVNFTLFVKSWSYEKKKKSLRCGEKPQSSAWHNLNAASRRLKWTIWDLQKKSNPPTLSIWPCDNFCIKPESLELRNLSSGFLKVCRPGIKIVHITWIKALHQNVISSSSHCSRVFSNWPKETSVSNFYQFSHSSSSVSSWSLLPTRR